MFTAKDILPCEKSSVEVLVYDQSKLYQEYEIDKCVAWVKERNIKNVCVQFSDDQLSKVPHVVHILEKKLNQKIYVLGDTSYGSCCIDEIAAQHVNADGIIHFGHSCLSPSERIPVLYIFNKEQISISEFLVCFQDTFKFEDNIVLLYDVTYYHAIFDVSNQLQDFNNLIVAALSIEETLVSPSHSFFGRIMSLPLGKDIHEFSIVFIGRDGPCITNFKYLFSEQPFFIYNPEFPRVIHKYDVNMSKFLQRRMFFIESLRNVKSLGILIGTLCVKSYLKAIERIKSLTKPRGIKCYIISVGKINVAKLANFPEIDAYVLIACAENSLLNSKEFLQSIVTPYEVELAFNSAYKWSAKYFTDFTTLLPGSDNFIEESFNIEESETNVSLVSGNVQNALLDYNIVEGSTDSQNFTIVKKGLDSLVLTDTHGSNFLVSRSWKGLEPKLGQTPVEKATKGRIGLPFKYENECDE